MKKKILLFCTMIVLSKAISAQEVSNDSTLTLKNLYAEIVKDSIKFPELVLRQAIWETGWFKSTACKKRNNLFGFNNGVSKFKTWQDAVLSYKNWQDKYYHGGDYEKFLIRIKYAKNTPEYIRKLRTIKVPKNVFE